MAGGGSDGPRVRWPVNVCLTLTLVCLTLSRVCPTLAMVCLTLWRGGRRLMRSTWLFSWTAGTAARLSSRPRRSPKLTNLFELVSYPTTHYTLHTTHYTLHTSLHTTHYTLHTTHYTLYTSLHTTHYTQVCVLCSGYPSLNSVCISVSVYLGSTPRSPRGTSLIRKRPPP
jgi:hypothetical protein